MTTKEQIVALANEWAVKLDENTILHAIWIGECSPYGAQSCIETAIKVTPLRDASIENLFRSFDMNGIDAIRRASHIVARRVAHRERADVLAFLAAARASILGQGRSATDAAPFEHLMREFANGNHEDMSSKPEHENVVELARGVCRWRHESWEAGRSVGHREAKTTLSDQEARILRMVARTPGGMTFNARPVRNVRQAKKDAATAACLRDRGLLAMEPGPLGNTIVSDAGKAWLDAHPVAE